MTFGRSTSGELPGSPNPRIRPTEIRFAFVWWAEGSFEYCPSAQTAAIPQPTLFVGQVTFISRNVRGRPQYARLIPSQGKELSLINTLGRFVFNGEDKKEDSLYSDPVQVWS